ncbi:MAG: MBL fold metallo-hydrolase [Deltaproteobacteria bacterium]|nr:MAG: MBL fold metallo-hydrolase [Deltaproteobacteria bacterium]
MGEAKSLRVKCLSEVAWKDDARMRLDIRESGGLETDQYEVKWTPGNAAGVLNLIDAVDGDGNERKVLVDVGWDVNYVEEVLKREGVDVLLAEGKIDAVAITHEHVDHFFGLPALTSINPDFLLLIPAGFTEKGRERIRASGHRGEVREMPPGEAVEIFPGIFSYTFPKKIFLRVQNEQVFYVDLAGKGVVTVTGCCHPGILDLLDRARSLFPGKPLHGVYGGLHICPFDEWTEEHDALIEKMKGYGVGLYACNHCTGTVTVRKMREAGLPVLSGSGRFGSKTDEYVGCGDVVEF